MAFHWHADDGQTLNACLVALILQGIRTCIARKPYIFVIFQGVRGCVLVLEQDTFILVGALLKFIFSKKNLLIVIKDKQVLNSR